MRTSIDQSCLQTYLSMLLGSRCLHVGQIWEMMLSRKWQGRRTPADLRAKNEVLRLALQQTILPHFLFTLYWLSVCLTRLFHAWSTHLFALVNCRILSRNAAFTVLPLMNIESSLSQVIYQETTVFFFPYWVTGCSFATVGKSLFAGRFNLSPLFQELVVRGV